MLKNLFNRNSIANDYKNLVNQINELENTLKILTDSELRTKTFQLQKKNIKLNKIYLLLLSNLLQLQENQVYEH